MIHASHTLFYCVAGTLLRKYGNQAQLAVAKDLLSEGLRYEPGVVAGWHELGLTCRALQHRVQSEQHLRTATALAASAPVLSFSQVPFI